MADLNPDLCATEEELVESLDRLRKKVGLSYGELARRAGLHLPRSTAHDMVKARRLPRDGRQRVRAWVLACGADPAAWERAQERLAQGRVEHRTPRRPWRQVPRQLPPNPAGFVGRDRELAELDQILRGGGSNVVVITGTAGAGKSALALRWAHRVADRFPDGHLYLDLRGFSSEPRMSVVDALSSVVRALRGRGETVPVGRDLLEAEYRTMLAGRSVLLVLDGAATEDQVRALLPPGPGSTTLVTSRNSLTGLVALDGARVIETPLLSQEEAETVLIQQIGMPAREEPGAVQALARGCARLPLALRICAAKAVMMPGRSLSDQMAELEADDPLPYLTVEGDPGASVGTAFSLSYADLTAAAQRAFRLIAATPGVDISSPAVQALLGGDPVETGYAIAALTDGHLLEVQSGNRLMVHDLLRRFGARLHSDGEAQAVDRLLAWYTRTAVTAVSALEGLDDRNNQARNNQAFQSDQKTLPEMSFPDPEIAQGWLDAERANLVAATVYASRPGPWYYAWYLAGTLRPYFEAHGHGEEWLLSSQAVLRTARAMRDPLAALFCLGLGSIGANETGLARERLDESLVLARRSGDQRLASGILIGLSRLELALHPASPETALGLAVDAVREARKAGVPSCLSTALIALADVDHAAGRAKDAEECRAEAVSEFGKAHRLARRS